MKTEFQPHINLSSYTGRPVAILGLGKSGLSAAHVLKHHGADVRAWDDDPKKRTTAKKNGISLVNLTTSDMTDIPELVLSPGIPQTFPSPHPIVTKARKAGCKIICDIELLARAETKAAYVGITGTNGKSTTTALIGHILKNIGKRSAIGGNIGEPALTLTAMGPNGVYALELSSYQLELISSKIFNVSILLNITPDHLDRHGDMNGYIAAKKKIFVKQKPKGLAIVSIDDDACREIYNNLLETTKTVIPISVKEHVTGGIYVEKGWLVDNRSRTNKRILDLRKVITLPGYHNAQNAAAAYAATSIFVDIKNPNSHKLIADAISTFPGLAHRQELIRTVRKCRFVNDSKATNAEATAQALASNKNIFWIAGGREKAGGISSLASLFPRIKHAFLIGEAAESFSKTLEGNIPYTISFNLENAVSEAAELSKLETEPCVVLLSPACSSFDQFSSFESRGEAFRKVVLNLVETKL